MSAEALIQIVCKNDEKRVFFNQIFFVFFIIRKFTFRKIIRKSGKIKQSYQN